MLELIKKQNLRKLYYTDQVAEQKGHNILRLPPYYCEFNPIEQIWHFIRLCKKKDHRTKIQ
jgi:transposase